MEPVLAVAALVVVAIVVGAVAKRYRTSPTPVRPLGALPSHLDRVDFPRPDAPWIVVLFSSATCASCAQARRTLAPLESADVAIADLEFPDARTIHERYGIDSVPSVVVADAAGVVRARFLGPPTAADLWARVAELRSGGGN